MSTAPAVNSLSNPSTQALAHRSSSVPSSLAPLLLTPLVLLIHGYHPFAGDAGIYVAGVRHILDPTLYPRNAAFVDAFAHDSLFSWALAAIVRLTHLPLTTALFAAHLLSIFFFLTAFHQLAARLFAAESARWSAVLLAAACFTLPIAGTALFLMDPYVTARSFSTPLSLLAVSAAIDRAWQRSLLFVLLAALVHPLMSAYTAAFVVLYTLVAARRIHTALTLCAVSIAAAGITFVIAHRTPISPDYREAVSLAPRTFLFLARWHWYEVLGLLLPLLLFAIALRKLGPSSRKGELCLTCLLLGITSLVIAALFVPPGGPYLLVPLQILRSFHLIYAIGTALAGGVFATLVSRSRLTVASLLVLLFAGMFAAQRYAWSACAHIEWPGAQPSNPYQQAFLWIRDHTPQDAVFAFNPQLVYLPNEDEQGFRAIAERDHLADDKDAGVVAVIPHLAAHWARDRNAQFSVNTMSDAERIAILKALGATWLLLPSNAKTQFPCPWHNAVATICKISP